MKVFITGDRSLDPINAIPAAIMGLQSAAAKWDGLGEIEFVTGSNETGVERAVRYLTNAPTVAAPETGADGKPDWDLRHAAVKAEVDAVVVVHGDPLASSIGKSVARVWGDDEERVLLVP